MTVPLVPDEVWGVLHLFGKVTPQTDAEAITAAKIWAEDLAAGALERDRGRRAGTEALARIGASGLLGITIPRELGLEPLAERAPLGRVHGQRSRHLLSPSSVLNPVRADATPNHVQSFPCRPPALR